MADKNSTLLGVAKKILNAITSKGLSGTIVTGTKVVTNAETAEQLTATSTPIRGVWISCPQTTATDAVYVGDSNVSSTRGIVVYSQSPPVFVKVNNLNAIYVDVSSNGDSVAYAYLV